MERHTEENKVLLDSMSDKEKLDRTTAEAFDIRRKLIFDYRKIGYGYYLTESDYPYKDSVEHHIIWLDADLIDYQMLNIFKTIKDHKDLGRTIIRNQPSNQSVGREHIHFIKFKSK